MKNKWKKMYLDIASRVASESHATKLKVGAVFVSENGVLSIGINGLPAGSIDNVCEIDGVTKLEVSHAEENVMTKLLRQGVSTTNGTMYQNFSPCTRCIKLLANAGIKEIYYLHEHKDLVDIRKYTESYFPNIRLIHYIDD